MDGTSISSRRHCPQYSALPPRMISVPRPAMLVATVTAFRRPACATIQLLGSGASHLIPVLNPLGLQHTVNDFTLLHTAVPTKMVGPSVAFLDLNACLEFAALRSIDQVGRQDWFVIIRPPRQSCTLELSSRFSLYLSCQTACRRV